ncbi:Do family serine endopeptidase [Flavobacteriaceae bacterium Ap0902]|nr:Do family serine endopeptidase [Flavobacteriaceae bacterium Ap0902]
MNNLFKYALVGVISAGTTFGLIEYTQGDNAMFQETLGIQTSESEEANQHFASYDYTSAGTALPDFTEAAEQSVNAVVSIQNYGKRDPRRSGGSNPFEFFNDPFFDQFFKGRGGQPQQQEEMDDMPTSAGSGVIISKDGYIVTNNHVIAESNRLEVTLNNKQTYTARLVGTDPNTDIALLKIDEDNLPFLAFFNSDNLKVGEWVLAVGNPFGLNSTVTAGIVSAKGRGIGILGRNGDHPIESFIQTDAAINPGNSGGALINTNGHLVGINTAIYSQTGSYAGYGFAVPANLVKKVVNDIKQFGMVQRGYLGVGAVDLSDDFAVKRYNKLNDANIKAGQGVMVTDLTEEGGALEAGLEKGDIIKEVDGKKINSFAALSLAVGGKSPGDSVKVTVDRDGSTRTYNVILKDLDGNAKTRSVEDLTPTERLGATFKPLTERQKIEFGIDSGVVVTSVKRNGILNQIGISEGYIILKINNKEVNSKEDIDKILKNKNDKVSVNFVDRYGRIYTKGFTFD